MGMPSHLLVKTASILSCLLILLVKTSRVSTSLTSLLTKSKRALSAASTTALSVKSMSPWVYGAAWVLPATEIAAATTAFNPSWWVETVSTTGQFSFSCKSLALILVFFFLLMSPLLSATTTGIPSSKSCVVKNKLLDKFVPSTMFTITSGFSPLTYLRSVAL